MHSAMGMMKEKENSPPFRALALMHSYRIGKEKIVNLSRCCQLVLSLRIIQTVNLNYMAGLIEPFLRFCFSIGFQRFQNRIYIVQFFCWCFLIPLAISSPPIQMLRRIARR